MVWVEGFTYFNGKIFVSYDEEKEIDCWNKSVIWADFNYEEIIFEKLFSSSTCVHSKNNPDKEFMAFQSGGRIVKLMIKTSYYLLVIQKQVSCSRKK